MGKQRQPRLPYLRENILLEGRGRDAKNTAEEEGTSGRKARLPRETSFKEREELTQSCQILNKSREKLRRLL